jgi:hypothetical protein
LRALNLLRDALHYRKSAFNEGLKACGYSVVTELSKPTPNDLLIIWNRYSWFCDEALRFERAGARVVVCENGYLGKEWIGGDWFAMSLGHHSGAGKWHVCGPERWDSLGVELQPWRGGSEVVILGQRGIGEPGIASPRGWAEDIQAKIGGRVRPHPGTGPCKPLADDLKDASAVVTWHSGAAFHALLMGIPVFYGYRKWIGAEAGRPLGEFSEGVRYGDRLSMFRRLIWAQWRLSEIRSGEAFRHLCTS